MNSEELNDLRTVTERIKKSHPLFPPSPDIKNRLVPVSTLLIHIGSLLEKRFHDALTASACEPVTDGQLHPILEDLLNYIYESFQTFVPYHRIGFAVLEDDNSFVRACWARSDAPNLLLPAGYRASLEHSSLARILDTGKPRILNDLEMYCQEHPESDATRRIVEEGMRSSLTCPLIASDKPLGFLFFSSREAVAYRHVHVEIFLQIANQLSLLIEKSILYQEIIDHHRLKDHLLTVIADRLQQPLARLQDDMTALAYQQRGNLPADVQQDFRHMGERCAGMLNIIQELTAEGERTGGNVDIKDMHLNVAEFFAAIKKNWPPQT